MTASGLAAAPTRLRVRPLAVALAALAGALVLGVSVGPVAIGPDRVFAEILDRLPLLSIDSGLTEREAAIVWQLRVPRVVLGGLVGGMLALAGGAYQGVFRNPLADPYLLGVAAGAGLGATIVIATADDLPLVAVAFAAFAGAVVAVFVTYGLARAGGAGTTANLILAGVAVAAFFTALQTFVQQRSSDTIREVFSWILGRLSTVGWSEVALLAPFAAVSALVLLSSRRLLDVLAVGEEEAGTLGLRTDRVRLVVVAAATLGSAAAVAVSGLIGFVGIVVPHTIRLMTGSSYRVILPLAVIGGAAFLIVADLLARTVISPGELPIGVVTAFVGAPFFGIVLRTAGRAA